MSADLRPFQWSTPEQSTSDSDSKRSFSAPLTAPLTCCRHRREILDHRDTQIHNSQRSSSTRLQCPYNTLSYAENCPVTNKHGAPLYLARTRRAYKPLSPCTPSISYHSSSRVRA